ncbi:hypothetical protein JCM1840_000803 [Sporobolomyces johnsonii]
MSASVSDMAASPPTQSRQAVPIFPSYPSAAVRSLNLFGHSLCSIRLLCLVQETISPSSSPEPPFHLEWCCPFHLERRLGLSPLHLPCHPDPICRPRRSSHLPQQAPLPNKLSRTPVPTTPTGPASAPQAAPSESSTSSTCNVAPPALQEALDTLRYEPLLAVKIAQLRQATGHGFLRKLGLDYSGLNFDGKEPASTNKPAFDTVTHFEISELADVPDDEWPKALYLCEPPLVGRKKNIYAFAPSSITPTRRAIGMLPRQVPGTSSLQFDQVMRAALADGRSFIMEIYESSPWLAKMWTSKEGREWAKEPSWFGSLLTSKKSAKEIKTCTEYANTLRCMMDTEHNSQVVEPKLSLDTIDVGGNTGCHSKLFAITSRDHSPLSAGNITFSSKAILSGLTPVPHKGFMAAKVVILVYRQSRSTTAARPRVTVVISTPEDKVIPSPRWWNIEIRWEDKLWTIGHDDDAERSVVFSPGGVMHVQVFGQRVFAYTLREGLEGLTVTGDDVANEEVSEKEDSEAEDEDEKDEEEEEEDEGEEVSEMDCDEVGDGDAVEVSESGQGPSASGALSASSSTVAQCLGPATFFWPDSGVLSGASSTSPSSSFTSPSTIAPRQVTLSIAPSTVCTWILFHHQTGSLQPTTAFCGRTPKLSADDCHILIAKVCAEPGLYLQEISEKAEEDGMNTSVSGVHRALIEAGMTHKALHKVALERNEEARGDFPHKLDTFISAEQVVYIDESAKDDHDMLRKSCIVLFLPPYSPDLTAIEVKLRLKAIRHRAHNIDLDQELLDLAQGISSEDARSLFVYCGWQFPA